MERRCALQQRARSSFEKAHAGEAPPRLQVIGFNVCEPPKAAETEARHLEFVSRAPHTEPRDLFFSPPAAPPAKPASSPRSALQQLLTQSLPSTSPPSPTHSLLHAASPLLPPNSSFGPRATSSPSTNQHVTSDDCKSLGQSQVVSSPSPTRNRSAEGASVNVHVTNQYSPKPSGASEKEEYAAFYDETGYTDKKIYRVERPDPKAEGKKSSPLQYDGEELSTASSSQKGVPQVSQCSLRNEKTRKSSWIEESTVKKSSLFMFIVSSPVPEVQRYLHRGEYDVCKDADFLSSCHLCRRHLGHGKDVFMYSGDKAFCSMECRYQQIVIDERKERCPPPIIRSGASQVYQHTYISTTSPTTTTHHPIAIGKPHFINTAAAA